MVARSAPPLTIGALGVVAIVVAIGGAAVPILAGVLIDTTRNYTAAFVATAACFGTAGAILARSRK